LAAAKRRGCDALITGEATFHTCLEAEALGIGLGLLGHYWSERFAMERLAVSLSEALPDLTIWPSRREYDPIVSVNL
jgi:putative NIF3 family GTP cyclohydrolase 1 type 2